MESFWLPFTANRQFKANPRLFVAAEGMEYVTADGRRILDAMAGLWCVNAGHGQRKIVEAIKAQAEKLDFVSSFQMSHPAAFELAARIAEITPPGLDHVFFTNSGSESVDTALKIARAYHRARGEGSRIRFIGRAKAYHGMGWGGLSVSGIVRRWQGASGRRRRRPEGAGRGWGSPSFASCGPSPRRWPLALAHCPRPRAPAGLRMGAAETRSRSRSRSTVIWNTFRSEASAR